MFYIQGWTKHVPTQQTHLAILSTIFSDGKVFVLKGEGLKTYFIFSKIEKSLYEINNIINIGLEAVGHSSTQLVLMEPKELRGSITSDFGKEEMDQITSLYQEFKNQDTPESIVKKMKDEIKD